MTSKLFSFRIESINDRHMRVTVYNRGANAGTLTILTEDTGEFVRRLSGESAGGQVAASRRPGAGAGSGEE